MKKLWQKDWELNPLIEAFETKSDLFFDQKMVEFECLSSLAHAKGLQKINILSQKELTQLKKGLKEIITLSQKNKFILEMGDEDLQTKIENFLTRKCGEAGQKIHTGRSRNDQSLTTLRLFTKAKLFEIVEAAVILAESFIKLAKKHEFTPMPGYTHMQKAMPQSVGMWAGSFAELLIDDIVFLKSAYDLNDQSPLGSAASFGVPFKLDRAYTAKLLGFGKIQNNSLSAQNSRGKIEGTVLASLVNILQTINKFTADLLLFTTSEFDYFEIDNSFFSGSSIMPQKKNLDLAELLRSKVHLVLGDYTQIVSLSANLPSGYNRDFQDIKKPLIESLEVTAESLKVTDLLVKSLKPKVENMAKALTPEIFATHLAFDMVEDGVPFRKAYKQALQNLSVDYYQNDFVKLLKKSTHAGGTGNLRLSEISQTLKKEQHSFQKELKKFDQAIKAL